MDGVYFIFRYFYTYYFCCFEYYRYIYRSIFSVLVPFTPEFFIFLCLCVRYSASHLSDPVFQVTEAKGLGWLLVGMVTCASADFFVARPQLMLVDITELGTIKLQLEVTWKYEHTHHTHTDTCRPREEGRSSGGVMI